MLPEDLSLRITFLLLPVERRMEHKTVQRYSNGPVTGTAIIIAPLKCLERVRFYIFHVRFEDATDPESRGSTKESCVITVQAKWIIGKRRTHVCTPSLCVFLLCSLTCRIVGWPFIAFLIRLMHYGTPPLLAVHQGRQVKSVHNFPGQEIMLSSFERLGNFLYCQFDNLLFLKFLKNES